MNSGMLTRLREALGISEREPVDSGLNRINSQLGLDRSTQSHEPRKAASIQVEATAAHPSLRTREALGAGIRRANPRSCPPRPTRPESK